MTTQRALWETNPLSVAEIEQLERLLARAQPLPRMQWPILRPMWQQRLMPFIPIELVVLRHTHVHRVTTTTDVLFRRRDARASDQEHWPNSYHFPGGYLGGGEHIDEAIQRILRTEIADSAVLASRQLIVTTNLPRMRRNHDTGLTFMVTLQFWPAELQPEVAIRPLNQPPEPLIPHHLRLHQRILSWVDHLSLLRRMLTDDLVGELLRVHNVVESDVE